MKRLLRWAGYGLLCASVLGIGLLGGCAQKKAEKPGASAQKEKVFIPSSVPGAAVAVTAENQLGVPYALGGKSPSVGFDAPGFIYWVFSQYGVQMPLAANEQALIGEIVNQANLEPGDTVVFELQEEQFLVGIYIGDNKFVYGPTDTGRVSMEYLTTAYWARRFVHGRRL